MTDLSSLTLEGVFAGAGFADIPASPLQRGICRVARGLPLDGILNEAEIDRYFGTTEIPEGIIPTLVVLVCGVRGGKSWLAACAAIHAALTSTLTRGGRKLKRHELPRFPIIGPDTDTADATFIILKGIIESSPVLLQFLDGDPTADTVVIKRPDGHRVEITVVAASRGGRTVRNRWLVGFILEEVAQFGNESDGFVINVNEILKAARTRLLDNCQGWLISSPYGPSGKLYELWKKHFGHPGSTFVVWAPTRALNPSFPQAEIDKLAEEDPDTAAREHDAQWLDPESAYLESILVDAGTRQSPIVKLPPPGAYCVCGMDTGTRANSWTVVVTCHDGIRVVVLGAWEWKGSKKSPLSPKATFAEMKRILEPYGIHEIRCDGWSFDANQDHAGEYGFTLAQAAPGEANEGYARLKVLLGDSSIELPPVPNLRSDLLALR